MTESALRPPRLPIIPTAMHAHPFRPAALRWRPTPLVKASLACHLGAAAALAAEPMLWPWALGVLAFDHALLGTAGLLPRSNWLGENLVRLPAAAAARAEIAITFDDGPDPDVTPAVLDLLDTHGARATFFCIAARASRHPALCRSIVARGHSVQNHSQRHRHNFSLLGMRGLAREIGQAQERLEHITGHTPQFFRAPAGLRNPLLAPVLQRLGLSLVSWTRRGYDTVRREPERVLARLVDGLGAGDILLLHDGNAALAASGKPVVVEVLPALLQRCRDAGLQTVTLSDAMRGGAR